MFLWGIKLTSKITRWRISTLTIYKSDTYFFTLNFILMSISIFYICIRWLSSFLFVHCIYLQVSVEGSLKTDIRTRTKRERPWVKRIQTKKIWHEVPGSTWLLWKDTHRCPPPSNTQVPGCLFLHVRYLLLLNRTSSISK